MQRTNGEAVAGRLILVAGPTEADAVSFILDG